MSGGQPQGKSGGKGDPILTGFDLRPFEFMGQPGNTYNLISEQRHQVRDIGQTAFSSALQPAMTSVKGPPRNMHDLALEHCPLVSFPGSARVSVSSEAGWRHSIRQQCVIGRCTRPSRPRRQLVPCL